MLKYHIMSCMRANKHSAALPSESSSAYVYLMSHMFKMSKLVLLYYKIFIFIILQYDNIVAIVYFV